MEQIADISNRRIIKRNSGLTATAAAFCLAPFFCDGAIPKRIEIEDIEKIYSSHTPLIVKLLTADSGWYAISGKELFLTHEGDASQLHVGEMTWMASSLAAMMDGGRHMKGVIAASKIIGSASTYTPYLKEIKTILDSGGITQLVEIGQGSGECICQLLASYPTVTGLAIDLDHEAAKLTNKTASKFGVSDRLTVITGDVNDGLPEDHLSGKMLIIAGFVMHDFVDIAAGIQTLSRVIPVGTRVVLAELVSKVSDDPFATAIIGFHCKSGKDIPSTDQWKQIFHDAGLHVENIEKYAVMPGAAIFNLVKSNPTPRFIPAAQKIFSNHDEEVFTLDLAALQLRHAVESALVDMSQFPEGISSGHTHDCDETYIITSGVVDVIVDGVTKQVTGPIAVYIPAGCTHHWKPVDVKKGDHIIGFFTKGGSK